MIAATHRWVCQVVRSGYHNGARCHPGEPHQDWGCGYRFEMSLPATDEARKSLEACGVTVSAGPS